MPRERHLIIQQEALIRKKSKQYNHQLEHKIHKVESSNHKSNNKRENYKEILINASFGPNSSKESIKPRKL